MSSFNLMMLSRFALSCWWISVQCKCSSTIVSVLCCVSALIFETEKSFPSNFWGHEGIARIDVSMMRNNNKNKEVSIFSPSALHTNFSYLMRLISCLLGPYLWVVGVFFVVCLVFFWILVLVFEFCKAQERAHRLCGGREERKANWASETRNTLAG